MFRREVLCGIVTDFDIPMNLDGMGGTCGTCWRKEKWLQDCGGEYEGKRPLGEFILGWEYIIKGI